MAKLKFCVHPLFILFGIYFALTGKVFSFIIFTMTAVLHETGHSLAALTRGYELNRIVLMPYGATLRGDTCDMTYKDEVFIAFSGPFVNLCAGLLLTALWWFVPESYPYTEMCVLANITIATVNLLPSYPLDGGRVLLAILSCYIKRKKAMLICKIIGIFTSIIVFALFIYSLCVASPNFSILFFACFILFGNIFVSKDNVYKRVLSYFCMGTLKNGKKVNVVAVKEDFTVRRLMDLYIYGELLECYVYNSVGIRTAVIKPEETIKILSTFKFDETIISAYKKLK